MFFLFPSAFILILCVLVVLPFWFLYICFGKSRMAKIFVQKFRHQKGQKHTSAHIITTIHSTERQNRKKGFCRRFFLRETAKRTLAALYTCAFVRIPKAIHTHTWSPNSKATLSNRFGFVAWKKKMPDFHDQPRTHTWTLLNPFFRLNTHFATWCQINCTNYWIVDKFGA